MAKLNLKNLSEELKKRLQRGVSNIGNFVQKAASSGIAGPGAQMLSNSPTGQAIRQNVIQPISQGIKSGINMAPSVNLYRQFTGQNTSQNMMKDVAGFSKGVGALTLGPTGYLASAGLGALTAPRGQKMQGAYQGIGMGQQYGGLTQFSNPLISKLAPAGLLAKTGIGGKAIQGGLNVVENMAQNVATGQPLTQGNLIALGMGAGGKQFTPNAKGFTVGRSSKTPWSSEDINVVEGISDFLRSGEKTTKEYKNKIYTNINDLADAYLPKATVDKVIKKFKEQEAITSGLVSELRKVMYKSEDTGNVIKMGIAGDNQVKSNVAQQPVTNAVNPLIQEAKKYGSAEEFVSNKLGIKRQDAYSITVGKKGSTELQFSVNANSIDEAKKLGIEKYLKDMRSQGRVFSSPSMNDVIIRDAPKNGLELNNFRISNLEKTIQKLEGQEQTDFTKKILESNKKELIRLKSENTKISQLTDIYNQSKGVTKGVDNRPPYIVSDVGTGSESKYGASFLDANGEERILTKTFSFKEDAINAVKRAIEESKQNKVLIDETKLVKQTPVKNISQSIITPPSVTKGVESMPTVKVSTTNPKTIKVVKQSTKPQQVSLKDIDNGLTPKSILEDKTIQQQGAASFDSSLPQRGFAKTVMESPKTPDVLKPSLEQQRYNPLSNKQTLSYADSLIKKSETDALNYARTGTDTNANATASRLIEKYLDAGRFDEADDLIRTVAPRFTKQGQDIQILATYGKLTPTGAVRYAQNLINKANKANPRLNLKLTPERTKVITQYAKDIKGLKDGSREKIVATAKLIQNIKDIVPTSVGQKISSIQTMMQLLNPKTAVRNVVGNTIFTGMENISDVLGSGIDNIVGIITGKRSKVLPSIKAQASGFVKGAKEGIEDVRLGIDTSGGIATQFDFQSKTFTDPIFGNLEKALNIELRVPDRAAYTAAFEGSINNQMRATGIKTPTEEMLQVAHADGLYRTFQDNSKLANFFSNVKKTLNILGTPDGKFGVGDFLLKYPRTPANILSRGLDYSPAGFAKGIYEVVRPLLTGQEFNQKAFVEALSRAMAGTGLITAGYVLADKGIITGKSEKDYDISSIKKTTGQGPFKLNVDALKRYWISGGQKQDAQNGDLLVSYDWAQPTSLQLAMGANSAMGGGNEGALDGVLNSLQGGVDTLTGQPMVKGLMDFATGVKNKGLVGASSELAINSLSGFSPSIMRQFANLSDTTQRSTYDPSMVKEGTNRLVATVPFARKNLQPKIDVFGKEMPNYEGGTAKRIFDIFFNPAFVSRVKENPAAKEVIDIYEKSGLTTQAPRVAPETVTINGQKVKVSPQEYTKYQRYIGTKTDAVFNELVKSPSFTNLSDDEKAKTMQNILTDINSAAKIEVFGNKPKTISTKTKSILAGDMNLNVSNTSSKSSGTKKAKGPKKPKKITIKYTAYKPQKITIKRSNVKVNPTIKKPKKLKLSRKYTIKLK